jgi:Cu-processing system permease protein
VASGGTARRVLAVAGLTLREALRRRVILAAILMSAAFLALYGVAAYFASTEILASGNTAADELMRRGISVQLLNMGLFPTSFLIALTALLAGAGAISGELDSGVIYGVLARPIRRAELVVGKFLGLAVMLALYAAAFYGSIIGIARWQMHTPLTNWPAALAILVLEPLPLLALALLGSTRLPTMANGVLGLAAYGLGFIGGLIEQIGGLIDNGTMVNLGILSSLLMPLDALHRLALSLLVPPGLLVFQGAGPPGMGSGATPSLWMVAYAIGYVAVMVWLAAVSFGRRDL